MADHLFAYTPGWTETRRVRGRRSAPARAGSRLQPPRRASQAIVVDAARPRRRARSAGWRCRARRSRSCDGHGGASCCIEAIARQAALALHHSRLVERNRLEERRKAILEERNRLARDIHDNLAQGFAAILMQLQAAQREVGVAAARASPRASRRRSISRARTWPKRAARSARCAPTSATARTSRRRSSGSPISGQRTTGVPIDVVVDELPRFGDGVEREIIGIAQEALTNARAPLARAAASRSARRPCRSIGLAAVGGRRRPRHRARARRRPGSA